MLPKIPQVNSLLMIWNAKSGWQNALLDSLHKIISPDTYPCSLCKITYGLVGSKPEWQEFLKGWNREVYFLHRDEFRALRWGNDFLDLQFPAVLQFREGKWVKLLSADQLGALGSLEELQLLLLTADNLN